MSGNRRSRHQCKLLPGHARRRCYVPAAAAAPSVRRGCSALRIAAEQSRKAAERACAYGPRGQRVRDNSGVDTRTACGDTCAMERGLRPLMHKRSARPPSRPFDGELKARTHGVNTTSCLCLKLPLALLATRAASQAVAAPATGRRHACETAREACRHRTKAKELTGSNSTTPAAMRSLRGAHQSGSAAGGCAAARPCRARGQVAARAAHRHASHLLKNLANTWSAMRRCCDPMRTRPASRCARARGAGRLTSAAFQKRAAARAPFRA